MYQDKWIFDQGNRRKLFSTLTVDECNYIAKYLGNIAELSYEKKLRLTRELSTLNS